MAQGDRHLSPQRKAGEIWPHAAKHAWFNMKGGIAGGWFKRGVLVGGTMGECQFCEKSWQPLYWQQRWRRSQPDGAWGILWAGWGCGRLGLAVGYIGWSRGAVKA